jgi:MFS transporter, FSR family, fosmidomycin resistance protein
MAKRALARPFSGARLLRRGIPLAFLFLLIEFFDEFHYGIQGAVLPSLRTDLGLTYAQAGILLGLPGIIGTLIEPLIMLLGDSPLRKRLVIGGGLAVAAAVTLLAGARTFPAALLAFTIAFPASGAFVTLSQATLMDLNPGRQPHMMARWTVFGSIGNLLGPLVVAAAFALGLGWRRNYIGLAILALALTALLLPRPFPAQQHPSGDVEQPGAAPGALFANLAQAARNPRLLRWFILLDLSDLLLDVFTSYSALYFADVAGFNPAQVGMLMGALMAASLLGNLALIPLLEHVPGRRLVRITAAITAFLYTAWLLAPWPWAKVALAIAVKLSTLGWYEVLQGEAYAALPGRSGTVMALSSVMGLLGGVLVWFIGWFAGQAGLPAAMWLLLAGPVALVLFLPR